MRLLSSISTRTLAGPNLSSLSLSLSLYLHYIRYTHSIFRIIIYRTYLLCCQIVQKTIKMLISEQPMSSNVICNGYDKAGFLSFVLYLLLCLLCSSFLLPVGLQRVNHWSRATLRSSVQPLCQPHWVIVLTMLLYQPFLANGSAVFYYFYSRYPHLFIYRVIIQPQLWNFYALQLGVFSYNGYFFFFFLYLTNIYINGYPCFLWCCTNY